MSEVVITGIGVISSLGTGREIFWKNCIQANSGIKKVTLFETDQFVSDMAGFVDDFTPSQYMKPMAYRRLSRISRMAVCASIEAIQDSSIDMDSVEKDRIAVILGTAYGSSTHVEDFYVSLLKDGPRGAQPFLFPETVPNAPASHIAIFHKITGPNTTFCHNDISAESAILYAKNLLEQDKADIVITGGADELSEMAYSSYNTLGVLNPVRSTDNENDYLVPGKGIILGEGAGILVMERADNAKKRGAKIYGKISSGVITGGTASVGKYDETGSQVTRSMELAIEQAELEHTDIDQIDISSNLSGVLEKIEHNSLNKLFNDKLDSIHVTPLKYLMGDFGGAGTIRSAAILLSLHTQHFLPFHPSRMLSNSMKPPFTWNTSNKNSEASLRNILMTTTTFGGGSISIVFKKCG